MLFSKLWRETEALPAMKKKHHNSLPFPSEDNKHQRLCLFLR